MSGGSTSPGIGGSAGRLSRRQAVRPTFSLLFDVIPYALLALDEAGRRSRIARIQIPAAPNAPLRKSSRSACSPCFPVALAVVHLERFVSFKNSFVALVGTYWLMDSNSVHVVRIPRLFQIRRKNSVSRNRRSRLAYISIAGDQRLVGESLALDRRSHCRELVGGVERALIVTVPAHGR